MRVYSAKQMNGSLSISPRVQRSPHLSCPASNTRLPKVYPVGTLALRSENRWSAPHSSWQCIYTMSVFYVGTEGAQQIKYGQHFWFDLSGCEHLSLFLPLSLFISYYFLDLGMGIGSLAKYGGPGIHLGALERRRRATLSNAILWMKSINP